VTLDKARVMCLPAFSLLSSPPVLSSPPFVCGCLQKLGSDEFLFEPSGSGSGHVTRNVRLTLNMIDMVQVQTETDTDTHKA
jgi:hypothetical protein